MKAISLELVNRGAISLVLAIFTVAAATGTSMGQSFESPVNSVIDSEQKTITVTEDIRYKEGDSEAWKLDLAMPANFGSGLRPALVIVHGGGWRGGSKSVDVYQKMMVDYAQQGYVTININYRLLDEAEFPACIEDVKTAVRWLRAHADQYQVDPDRIGAYGHSAGAHLAMMLAMAPESASLEGEGWNEYSSMVNVAAAGSPPTELGRDTPMAKEEWWPIGYIAGDHPPLFLIQGSEDSVVRPELTEDFVEKMKDAGADIKYMKLEGGHGVAYNEQLDVTEPALEEFFAKHLKPGQQ
ncbi:alpha/beta hydrolase [Aliifodinibius sp. S!AR15-10]|uniref:alpha/beta hydrolase n=1 Tax=Aliifodinibius sp. S!AR15-10 TaxID=2950437 RepID=UPI002857AE7E|nr:alpha/beta hydrolase [Aliifodinibius sp. S!AR15-10]MDR8394192.1 alpha/beta hydrolase [Aliifodinibius sp. S!AR15-10]